MNREPVKVSLRTGLKSYVGALRHHWVGCLVIVLAAIGTAGIISLVLPRSYTTHASGMVRLSFPAGSAAPTDDSAADEALSRAHEYLQLATSEPIARRVIEITGLETTTAALRNSVKAIQLPNKPVIGIVANSSSPDDARKTADAWIQAIGEQVNTPDVSLPINADHHTAFGSLAPADLPRQPSSPDVSMVLLIGTLGGLLLALAYALFRGRSEQHTPQRAEFEAQFGVPLIGMLPHDPALAKAHPTLSTGSAALDENDSDSTAITEAIHAIHAKLMSPAVDITPRTIVVTSLSSGGGTSTVATRLARAIARDRQPVILVDGNLRAAAHEADLTVSQETGFTDVLKGNAQLSAVLSEPKGAPFARVLAAGTATDEPEKIIASSATKELIDSLSGVATVVIDTPPTTLSSHAALFASLTSGVIVITGTTGATDDELGEALESIHRAHGTVLGVVLNKHSVRQENARERPQSSRSGRRASTTPTRGERVRSLRERLPQLVRQTQTWQQDSARSHRDRATSSE